MICGICGKNILAADGDPVICSCYKKITQPASEAARELAIRIHDMSAHPNVYKLTGVIETFLQNRDAAVAEEARNTCFKEIYNIVNDIKWASSPNALANYILAKMTKKKGIEG